MEDATRFRSSSTAVRSSMAGARLMLNNVSLYKSSRGYAAMMRTYHRQLARWPVPVREMELPTRYGETHLLACGPEDAPPLVLLHGLAANALVWRPNIEG